MNNVTVDFNIGSILSILLIIFIILKVSGVINWSWGIVLLPLWIGLGAIGVAFLIAIIIAIIVAVRQSKS